MIGPAKGENAKGKWRRHFCAYTPSVRDPTSFKGAATVKSSRQTKSNTHIHLKHVLALTPTVVIDYVLRVVYLRA